MQKFGAQIYVADLVGIAMVRLMAAIMTGIVMAGRTGGAFAAQLGTMQVNEEIDALQTLGISPMEYLVLPRMVALGLMMPPLCLYANFMGILGGMVVAVWMLDIGFMQYYHETVAAVGLWNLGIGLFSGFVFGIIVALAGCMRGMQCGRSASAVGDAATSAVVTAIVGIILATAVITVLVQFFGNLNGGRAIDTARKETMKMAEKEAHITVRDLTMAYGDFVVMRDLTFDINRGDIFIVMGGSGCGKSTLMRILIGLKPPAKGKVLYGEVDFWGTDPRNRDRIMRRRRGHVSERSALEFHDPGREYFAAAGNLYGFDRSPDPRGGRMETGPGGDWPDSKSFIPRRSAAACKSGPVSPGPWPWIRKSCFSMSLPPGWIR